MVFLQFHMVCTGTIVEAVNPRVADKLNQVIIAPLVLGQHNQVIAAKILFHFSQAFVPTSCHIHLTTEDRFKRFLSLLLTFFVHVIADVMKFLNAEHVPMIRDSHALHTVSDGFVHKPFDT